MAKTDWTINMYTGLVIDKTKTVWRTGKNGILYEYLLPYGGNPMYYYEDAVDVRSHKSKDTSYDNGKRPGEYQPIGDKRYFTFYQLNKMTPEEYWEFWWELYLKQKLVKYIKEIEERVDR